MPSSFFQDLQDFGLPTDFLLKWWSINDLHALDSKSLIDKVFISFLQSISFLFERNLIGCFNYFNFLINLAITIGLEFGSKNLKALKICLEKDLIAVIELEKFINFAFNN